MAKKNRRTTSAAPAPPPAAFGGSSTSNIPASEATSTISTTAATATATTAAAAVATIATAPNVVVPTSSVEPVPVANPTSGATSEPGVTDFARRGEPNGHIHDDNDNDDGIIFLVPHTDDSIPTRVGTVGSARFNILSTMVGGGCLSLPLAFQQSGNGLLGPLVLILTGLITDFCFRLLVACAVQLKPPHPTTPGKDSFESITSAAFGPKAYILSMGLVTAMCFFGAVGYAVLLRDMMEPINDLWPTLTTTTTTTTTGFFTDGSWLHNNLTLFVMILIVTPATTLTSLTALQNCGAASMTSLLILGTCIVIRSVQCNIRAPHPWYTYVTFWPDSPRDFLNAIPLYISCFVCHYNILPVHNELLNPTPARVSWWLRSTTWFAVGLYMIMGFAGSCYGHCTESGKVQGNVLLDFDENDPLLMVGRMCLALTITLAFPMLVIPARDILLRSVILPYLHNPDYTNNPGVPADDTAAQLQEPLLSSPADDEERPAHVPDDENASLSSSHDDDEETIKASFRLRLITSIAIFWTAGLVASCVASIDIVWDLLGSSLSILLSFLIPCGSYLVIMRNVGTTTGDDQDGQTSSTVWWSKVLCWILILFFVPLMFVSTGNAVANTFFSTNEF